MDEVLEAFYRLKNYVDEQAELGEDIFPDDESKNCWDRLKEFFINGEYGRLKKRLR